MEASVVVGEEASSAFEHVPYGEFEHVPDGAFALAQTAKRVQTAEKRDWLLAVLIFGPVLAMYVAIGYAAYALIA
jgi:hypothetical protein